ncbi:MAG TPA: aminopeptidase N, partial [Alcanivorax sp.]|nr:aminopeptidase N [Alcanivorax sp.]
MRDGNPAPATRLIDYRPPAWLVDHTRLDVDLRDGHATVTAELAVRRNPARDDRPADLVLDGDQLQLRALRVDDRVLGEQDYRLEEGRLTVPGVPDQFTLTSEVRIHPESNTALEGLYRSNGMYCTQCEAEGFRRITYFPDRPDVLSRFTTTIHADRAAYPLLLSNGNPVDGGDEDGGRHFATWEDPFPKPCYLFALVAGDLACLEDSFRTASGRNVALRLYAEHRDLDKLGHAMDSLKRAMAWDEQVFGREYDLDIFQVVAVSHFNMGAMENKGLNIFNTSCVLAHPATTTDAGFERVESV